MPSRGRISAISQRGYCACLTTDTRALAVTLDFSRTRAQLFAKCSAAALVSNAMAKVRVAIVGGGIGGLACALSLCGRKGKERASNVEVTVYEAAPCVKSPAFAGPDGRSKFEEIGAGVRAGCA